MVGFYDKVDNVDKQELFENCSPFLGEKPESNTLAVQDFVIVIQTEFQSYQMKRFAHKNICCDATHGTTGERNK